MASRTTERFERAFLGLSGAMLVVFLAALFYSAFGMGVRLPDDVGDLDPTRVTSTPPFDEPGVRQTGPASYEVVLIASAWRYDPARIEVPAGATVTIRATSADVIHGFYVDDTRLNVMLIPGQITEVTHTFGEPGTYLFLCHEYCGVGHHQMYGEIVVTPATGEAGIGVTGEAGSGVTGEAGTEATGEAGSGAAAATGDPAGGDGRPSPESLAGGGR